MKKLILMCVLSLYFCLSGFAQFDYNYKQNAEKEESKSWFDPAKLRYGGGFGFAVGSNNYWNIFLSPQVGYELTKNFVAGLGVTYSHSREKYDLWTGGRQKHVQNYVGVNLFAHYYPTSWALLTVKPEGIRVWDSFSGAGGDYEQEEFVPAVVVGAGVRFKPMFITLNYDLVQSDRNPYGDNLFWSVGFFF